MEHQFHAIGQSCANACDLAIENGLAIQDVPYEKLKERILEQGVAIDASAVGSPNFGDESC